MSLSQWVASFGPSTMTGSLQWIPSLLEFGKHAGERLLGLGAALGSDLVQYACHGAEVVSACASAEQLSLVRRNFELRGLHAVFVHAAHVERRRPIDHRRDAGAPKQPRMWLRAAVTSAVAAVLWVGIYVLVKEPWISFRGG